jgi:hypothetical protein
VQPELRAFQNASERAEFQLDALVGCILIPTAANVSRNGGSIDVSQKPLAE